MTAPATASPYRPTAPDAPWPGPPAEAPRFVAEAHDLPEPPHYALFVRGIYAGAALTPEGRIALARQRGWTIAGPSASAPTTAGGPPAGQQAASRARRPPEPLRASTSSARPPATDPARPPRPPKPVTPDDLRRVEMRRRGPDHRQPGPYGVAITREWVCARFPDFIKVVEIKRGGPPGGHARCYVAGVEVPRDPQAIADALNALGDRRRPPLLPPPAVDGDTR